MWKGYVFITAPSSPRKRRIPPPPYRHFPCVPRQSCSWPLDSGSCAFQIWPERLGCSGVQMSRVHVMRPRVSYQCHPFLLLHPSNRRENVQKSCAKWVDACGNSQCLEAQVLAGSPICGKSNEEAVQCNLLPDAWYRGEGLFLDNWIRRGNHKMRRASITASKQWAASGDNARGNVEPKHAGNNPSFLCGIRCECLNWDLGDAWDRNTHLRNRLSILGFLTTFSLPQTQSNIINILRTTHVQISSFIEINTPADTLDRMILTEAPECSFKCKYLGQNRLESTKIGE